MNLSLEGKRAIICGSSQGIGKAIAIELAALGASCILLARNREKLAEVKGGLQSSASQNHKFYEADFNDQEATRGIVESILKEGPVHILVNNSGGPASGPITEAKEDQFLQAFNQHLIVSHLLTTSVSQSMKKEGWGRIINIISTSVKIPLKNLGVSNTIRGAMASWAKTMSMELGPFGITVNNVLPGFTTTDRLSTIVSNTAGKLQKSEAEVEKSMVEEVPLKRFGKPEEIAALAAFLASPAASYINGTSIPVDGGRTGSI